MDHFWDTRAQRWKQVANWVGSRRTCQKL